MTEVFRRKVVVSMLRNVRSSNKPLCHLYPLLQNRVKCAIPGSSLWSDTPKQAASGIDWFSPCAHVILQKVGDFCSKHSVNHYGGSCRCGRTAKVGYQRAGAGKLGDRVKPSSMIEPLVQGRASDRIGKSISDFSHCMTHKTNISRYRLVEQHDGSCI